MRLYIIEVECTELGFEIRKSDYEMLEYKRGGYLKYSMGGGIHCEFHSDNLDEIKQGRLSSLNPILKITTMEKDLIDESIVKMKKMISTELEDRMMHVSKQLIVIK